MRSTPFSNLVNHLVAGHFKRGIIMNRLICKILMIGFFTFSVVNAFAQIEADSLKQGQPVLIKMINGDEFKGEMVSKSAETIVLKTVNGEVHLLVANIKTIEDDTYIGKFPFSNPHDTRYFFGPSAIAVKKGKGYYQNIFVTGNFVNYGLTDHFSIGGGLEFISTLSGMPIWFFTPKVAYDLSEKTHVGGGIFMAGFAAEGTATLAYGVFTRGDSDSNFSLGLGYGLVGSELSSSPALMLAGMHRISKGIALMTENYAIPGQFYFGIHGIRMLSKNNSFDLGGMFLPGLGGIPALPYVNYVRVF